MRIAVLRNSGSSRNLGRPAPSVPAGVMQIDLGGIASLNHVLIKLAEDSIDLLVIDGGDGTVREIVSRLPEAFPDGMPMVGILANGNTNLIARRCGRIRSYGALIGLDEATLLRHHKTVPVLRIDGLADGPVRGFITGWAAYAAGTRIAVEEISSRGGWQIALAILAVLKRVLWGRDAASLRAGSAINFAPQGHSARRGQGFLGIATVLEGPLIIGLKPFWGTGNGAIRWLDIAAPPSRLWAAAPFVALGLERSWMRRRGYHSGRSSDILMQVDCGLVVDGELFATSQGQQLRFSAQETIRVVAI
ncbi:MAG: diacylglycerol kinase family protein [Pseudomonadota bacterium]